MLLRTQFVAITFASVIFLSGMHGQTVCKAAARQADAGQAIVMTVSNRNITAAELCSAIASLPPPQRKGYESNPALARDWYGPLVALSEEAKREHLATSADKGGHGVDLDNALVGELIENIARQTQPTESEMAQYYATHKGDFEQVKARHILVSDAIALASRSNRSADEAKTRAADIVSQLKQGAEFGALARKESDDPYTKNQGGDLGYISHHQLEPAMDEEVWSLPIAGTSAPFEGRFGYEIVKVEERRPLPLDAVRESIAGKIKTEVLERKQQEIVGAAHITMDPLYVNSPLPCETSSRAFTLPDSLQAP